MTTERFGNPDNGIVHQEFIERFVESAEHRLQTRPKGGVLQHQRGDEGQPVADILARHYERRIKIQHAIAETDLRPGTTIVQLIGMQDDDLTGQAVPHRPAIKEALDSRLRETDRIGVVSMEREGGTGEARGNAGNARQGRR